MHAFSPLVHLILPCVIVNAWPVFLKLRRQWPPTLWCRSSWATNLKVPKIPLKVATCTVYSQSSWTLSWRPWSQWLCCWAGYCNDPCLLLCSFRLRFVLFCEGDELYWFHLKLTPILDICLCFFVGPCNNRCENLLLSFVGGDLPYHARYLYHGV